LGDARNAQGRRAEALDLHRRALAVRRDRAERHAGFIFVGWELTRSLNAVATLLLAESPSAAEAEALFAEAREVGLRELQTAPSYTQVRKQVAIAEEGLARAALRRGGASSMLKQSAATWREVLSRSVGDSWSAEELARIESLIAKRR
jgi:hypothetical protein